MNPNLRIGLALVMTFFLVGVSQAQTGANCNVPCDKYLSELQSVTQLYDTGVNTIGATLSNPTGSIKSMCDIEGDDIQTCYECSHSNGLNSQLRLLNAWWETCVTYQHYGQDVSSAYKCWKSIPNGSGSCYAIATNDAHRPRSQRWTHGVAAAIGAITFFVG